MTLKSWLFWCELHGQIRVFLPIWLNFRVTWYLFLIWNDFRFDDEVFTRWYHVPIWSMSPWIGLRDNVQDPPDYFMGKTMVSCRFALQPIQWIASCCVERLKFRRRKAHVAGTERARMRPLRETQHGHFECLDVGWCRGSPRKRK
jgi:hypothetical protein